ncbi:hypothetical protein WD019_02495 [Fictibacillus sp. Mic-4]|uniref:hypothetical protein n=1 Tax=Fictibacillus sp. Mic-4 TaxID=3132826 RepID=UPI003CF45060
MVNVTDANVYINANVIDVEDWNDADEAKKTRIVNVAKNTLAKQFPGVVIPDNAVYEFCAKLAWVFNDTNRMAYQGVASMSIQGVASFTFKDAGPKDLAKLIPQTAIDLINEANPGLPDVSLTALKWTVM